MGERKSRSVRAGALVLALCALAVGSSLPSKATSEMTHTVPGRSFASEGTDCLETSTFVPVPVSRLQRSVPAPFTAKQYAPGVGLLAVAIGRCDSMAVDDGPPASDAIFSDVGIAIEPPDGSVDSFPIGKHFYQLWHVSNVDEVVSSMSKIGMRTGLVDDASFGVTTDQLTATPTGVKGVMPWSYSTYELSNTGPVPGPGEAVGGNWWWHEGDAFPSVVRIERTGTAVGSQPGSGQLSMRPGSPLAAVAGTTDFVGAAMTISIGTESGRIQLVNLETNP